MKEVEKKLVEIAGRLIYPQVSFRRPHTTVPGTTERILSEASPISGKVNTIVLHYPNGCNQLVEITCYINQEPILPIVGDFIALKDATEKFPINRLVRKDDKLRVKIANTDVGPHTPNIIWNMEGVT